MFAFLFNKKPKYEIVPPGIDYEILKEVSELYLSRRAENPLLKDFHWFTMDILRKHEPTSLERSYKAIIRNIIKEQVNQGGADFVLFEDIEVSNGECCLHVTFYKKCGYNGPFLQCNIYPKSFGKVRKPTPMRYPMTTISIRVERVKTCFEDVLSMF